MLPIGNETTSVQEVVSFELAEGVRTAPFIEMPVASRSGRTRGKDAELERRQGRKRFFKTARRMRLALNHSATQEFGGEGEIRTHEKLAPLAVFKTAALDRSATSPAIKPYITVIPPI